MKQLILSTERSLTYQIVVVVVVLLFNVSNPGLAVSCGDRIWVQYLSRVTRKPDFCLCENKGADQLRSNCEADQRLCFRYTDSTLSLLIKSEISSFYAASGTVHVGLCQTWSETPKTGFLASRLISSEKEKPRIKSQPLVYKVNG